MDERPSFNDNLKEIFARSLAGFTLANVLWLGAVTVGCFGFLGVGLWLSGEEELFLAPWWMRVVQGALVVAMVALAYSAAKFVPPTASVSAGRRSNAFTLPYLAAVLCFLVSHGVIWGGLHHLHPGPEVTLRGTVTASGIRHGKSSHGHGDWVEVQLPGHPGSTRVETDAYFAIYSDNEAKVTYQCSLHDTRAGDTLDLRGNQSVWGFAVTRFVPVNARLLQACRTSS